MSNGLFGNIMSVFSPGATHTQASPQQPAQQPAQPQQPAPQNNPGAVPGLDPNGAAPTAGQPPNSQQHQPGAAPAEPAGGESPLDQFKDLFTIENDPNAAEADPNSSWFNLDQDKMLEAAGKVSFTNVPQFSELAQKALSGDVEAFGQVMDTVMRGAYVRNAMLAGTISEKAGRAALEKVSADLPNRVRDISSQESVAKLNPMFEHPAMRPVVDNLRQQIQRKYPDASSQKVAELTNDYLSTISKQLSTPQDDPTDRRKAENATGEDFSNFFS